MLARNTNTPVRPQKARRRPLLDQGEASKDSEAPFLPQGAPSRSTTNDLDETPDSSAEEKASSQRIAVAREAADTRSHPLFLLTCGLAQFFKKISGENTDSDRCSICLKTGISQFPSNCPTSVERTLELCPYCPAKAIMADRYLLIKQLGVGTFSQVFLVKDIFIGECRVVKLLKSGLDRLAESEANYLALLSYFKRASVPHFHGQVCFYGRRGLLLEHLKPIDNSFLDMKRLIVDVAGVLFHLHENLSSVHADIKLENVMWSESHSRFRVIDFGNCVPLDRLCEYEATFEIQSFPFRAPEVLVGASLSAAIDVWSLGIAIAWLLGGRHPFIISDILNGIELLTKVCEIVGPLPSRFGQGRFYEDSLPLRDSFEQTDLFWQRWRKSNVARLLGIKDPELVDLLSGMLDPDPKVRLSASDLLRHSYLAPLVPFPPSPSPPLSLFLLPLPPPFFPFFLFPSLPSLPFFFPPPFFPLSLLLSFSHFP